jgi:hypothetical protein
VQITEADVRDIFEPLARHAQLTTRQLVAFGTRHPITTKARLGELWHMTELQSSHWLHRLNEELPLANHLFAEDMHRLGDQGLALLQSSSIIPAEDWVYPQDRGRASHRNEVRAAGWRYLPRCYADLP